jgi:hypothetical protein
VVGTWLNWRLGGALRWKGETVGWEGREVVCDKPAPPRLCSTGATFASTTTATWKGSDATATRFPLRTAVPWTKTNHPSEQHHTHHEGQPTQARALHLTAEPRPASRRSHLTGKQTATAVQLDAQLRCDPVLKTERILMVDFIPTQAKAKELAPPVRRGETQAEATVAKSLSTPPPLTVDGVDMMYCQLAEIHAITATHLAECACWCRTDSTPCSVRA